MLFSICRTPVLDGFFDLKLTNRNVSLTASMSMWLMRNICFSLHSNEKRAARHVWKSVLYSASKNCVCCGTYTSPTGRPDGSLESPWSQECECRGGVAFFCISKKSLSRHLRRNLQLRDNARGAVCCGTYTSPTGRPDGSFQSATSQRRDIAWRWPRRHVVQGQISAYPCLRRLVWEPLTLAA